jgi:hypothetical protein
VLEQQADLVEAHAGALGDVDDRQPAQHGRVVAALPAHPLGLGQQPDVLVVADQRRLHARLLRHLADPHPDDST